jgi:hypothetical protein
MEPLKEDKIKRESSATKCEINCIRGPIARRPDVEVGPETELFDRLILA